MKKLNEMLEKMIVRRCVECFISKLSGMRKIPLNNDYKIYNDALGNVYDMILDEYEDYLNKGTLLQGKWIRD